MNLTRGADQARGAQDSSYKGLLSFHRVQGRQSMRSMCSMCSMRGGFIFRSLGPLQKVCHDPARMSGHNCLPGPQTVCFPGGRQHEQNEEVPQMDGSAGRTHTIRTAHTFSLMPQLLLLSVDFVPHPQWVKHWAPVGGGGDSHSLSVPTDLGEDQPGHM
jgi:hypothetical protein